MDRRTAVYLLMISAMGVMGAATISYPQEKVKPEPKPDPEADIEYPVVFAGPIMRNPEPKEMTLTYPDSVETLIVEYKGQQKKINLQQLFDAL